MQMLFKTLLSRNSGGVRILPEIAARCWKFQFIGVVAAESDANDTERYGGRLPSRVFHVADRLQESRTRSSRRVRSPPVAVQVRARAWQARRRRHRYETTVPPTPRYWPARLSHQRHGTHCYASLAGSIGISGIDALYIGGFFFFDFPLPFLTLSMRPFPIVPGRICRY